MKSEDGKKIILVVDDDRTVLRVATEVLRHHFSCEVEALTDPEEALRRFQGNREGYRLVVCDLNMPGLNGLDLCRLLRKERENIPIVMLTAFGSESACEQASSVGINEFVQKPFKPQALVDLIGKLLEVPDKRAGRMKGFERQFLEQANLILNGKIPAGFSSLDFILRVLKKNNYEPEKVARFEKLVPLLKTEMEFMEARDNYLYLKTLQDQRVDRIRTILRGVEEA